MKSLYTQKFLTIILVILLPLLGWGQNYKVITLAGSGRAGYADGKGSLAAFKSPNGLVVDTSGNVFVADIYNNRIRKISPLGVVTTFAGSGKPAFADGTGEAASFNMPSGIAIDKAGNLYVTDSGNQRIRKISPKGEVTTLAGSGKGGFADATGTYASFQGIFGIAVDANGYVYVTDAGNYRIRKISPTGEVTTLAGSGVRGYSDGKGTAASFFLPFGIAVDTDGNLFVSDTYNNRIRKVNSEGIVTTFAGSGKASYTNGLDTSASFSYPNGLIVDATGNLFVVDQSNNRVRKISSTGRVTTIAGSGKRGNANGLGKKASFNKLIGIAIDGLGNIYVSDEENNNIRKISLISK